MDWVARQIPYSYSDDLKTLLTHFLNRVKSLNNPPHTQNWVRISSLYMFMNTNVHCSFLRSPLCCCWPIVCKKLVIKQNAQCVLTVCDVWQEKLVWLRFRELLMHVNPLLAALLCTFFFGWTSMFGNKNLQGLNPHSCWAMQKLCTRPMYRYSVFKLLLFYMFI